MRRWQVYNDPKGITHVNRTEITPKARRNYGQMHKLPSGATTGPAAGGGGAKLKPIGGGAAPPIGPCPPQSSPNRLSIGVMRSPKACSS